MSQVGFIIPGTGLTKSTRAKKCGSDISCSVSMDIICRNGCSNRNIRFRSSSKYAGNSSRALYLFGFVLLSFCIIGGLSSPADASGNGSNEIQSKIRNFLELHCKKQNQSLEQMEFEDFISCNPTHAVSTLKNLEAYKVVDGDGRHREIQKEINKQCSSWPQEKGCQKKNFKLIQKCFDGQQKFVFYFMFALTDTICQEDGHTFIEFWEKGGDKCLQEHLPNLVSFISSCFIDTSTATKEQLDRNIGKITKCIGEKFKTCSSSETNEVLSNLLLDIQAFYSETKSSANSSSALSLKSESLSILISLSLFIFIAQRVSLS